MVREERKVKSNKVVDVIKWEKETIDKDWIIEIKHEIGDGKKNPKSKNNRIIK